MKPLKFQRPLVEITSALYWKYPKVFYVSDIWIEIEAESFSIKSTTKVSGETKKNSFMRPLNFYHPYLTLPFDITLSFFWGQLVVETVVSLVVAVGLIPAVCIIEQVVETNVLSHYDYVPIVFRSHLNNDTTVKLLKC